MSHYPPPQQQGSSSSLRPSGPPIPLPSAKHIESFATAFSLSAQGMFPRELLVVEYPAPLAASGGPNRTRRADSIVAFLDSSAMLSHEALLMEQQQQQMAQSRRQSVVGLGNTSKTTNPTIPKPAPIVSLVPGVADQPISLEGFMNFLNNEEAPDVPFVGASRYEESASTLPTLGRQASSIPQNSKSLSIAIPITQPPPPSTTTHQPEPSRVASTLRKKAPAPSTTNTATAGGIPILLPKTAMEKRSVFSTLQIPPSTYTSFTQSKIKKREQRERAAEEAAERLRNPPPKVEPKSTTEVFSSMAATANRVLGHFRVATPLPDRCTTAMTVLHARRCVTPGSDVASSTGGVRIAAAQRLLDMLDDAAREDTLLGLQQRQRAISSQRGMSGMGSRCHTPMPFGPQL